MNFIQTFRSITILIFTFLLVSTLLAAADPSLSDKAKEALGNTKAAVQDASDSAGKAIGDLWTSIDKNRLKNRTPDQIVAWIIMGALVGAVAGMATSMKSTGLGKAGRLLLGLVGAFIGGMVVRVAQIDYGWGPVLIRYEELLFSFLGAVVLIVIGRFLRARSKKPEHQ